MIRPCLGVLVKDVPRFVRGLVGRDAAYLQVHNRAERMTAAPFGAAGYRCEWRWTSELSATKSFPSLGRWLVRRALADRPIHFADAPSDPERAPEVTFIIGHRGRERSRLLDLTLSSIAAQHGAVVEVLVVEQAPSSSEVLLPPWVRHIVTPTPEGAPYNRAWAFNVGARAAKGTVIVLHDGDMLVPADYANRILDHVRGGSEVVDLKRFIFYLSENDTKRVCDSHDLSELRPIRVVQNLLGGGSVAITTESYARLGGMDEGFVGWGGEDSEFWERCALLPRWDYSYLPIIHLWHRDQPRKEQGDNPTADRYQRLAQLPAADRAARLVAATRGGPTARVEDPFADVLNSR